MGPPVMRSRASSLNSRAAGPSSKLDSESGVTDSLAQTLSYLGDDATVRGRDAKCLRDATVQAITDVWNDNRSTTAWLTQKINEGNSTLLADLNHSFAAVGERIDGIPAVPVVASLNPDGSLPRVVAFSGSNDDPLQFSMWLRRLGDVMRMRSTAWTSQQKACFLIGHLDGVAREKVEELLAEQRDDFDAVVAHLKNSFEGPQHRYMARQALSFCQQQTGESASAFANRLLTLVRAVTAGQDPVSQKERVLEEFIARLRPDVRYYVKLDNPNTFEQAVSKAQMVEQLLAEAVADRLIHPASFPRPVEVKATTSPRCQPPRNFRDNSSFRPNTCRSFQNARSNEYRPTNRRNQQTCFNCGGRGHFARQCPTSSNPRRGSGTSQYVDRDRHPLRNHSSRPPSPWRRASGPVESRELSEAREQIKTLTLSLRENKSALAQADARVSALLKRNEELAEQSLGRQSSCPSSSLPHVKALIAFTALIVCQVTEALPSSAWICSHDNSDVIAKIPTSYNCSLIVLKFDSLPIPQSLHVYRPNTQRYDTPASLCKIVTVSITYSVNFFGARYENRTETHQVVPLEACKLMIQHHKCEFGTMIGSGNVWSTSNPITVDWPSAPFGCCTLHTVTVSNCVLVATTVHMRHGADFPDSPVGNLQKCSYETGSCTLQDGSALLWTPSKEELCRYVYVTKMKGHMMGDVWISDSKEFALSRRDSSRRIQDCAKDLIISDQGYALAPVTRVPRAASAEVGIVSSNQLAAQLLAVEGTVQTAVSALFRHALAALCDRTNLLALGLHSALENNPSFTVRQLLGRNDIAGSYMGNNIVQIHRCMAIPSQNLRLVPFNDNLHCAPSSILPP